MPCCEDHLDKQYAYGSGRSSRHNRFRLRVPGPSDRGLLPLSDRSCFGSPMSRRRGRPGPARGDSPAPAQPVAYCTQPFLNQEYQQTITRMEFNFRELEATSRKPPGILQNRENGRETCNITSQTTRSNENQSNLDLLAPSASGNRPETFKINRNQQRSFKTKTKYQMQ